MRTLKAVDLFCGAGGTSTGLLEACEELGYNVELTAINHWKIAIATHASNHPGSRHLCTGLDSVNPRDLYKEGELDVLWASPECCHHSVARGGKPIREQSRATAWCVTRWADALKPNVILVENVREFEEWGPCVRRKVFDKKTQRHALQWVKDPKHKGEIFAAWVKTLEAIGYRVGWRVLCAADYGDPTTRRRLFIMAVRGRRKIVWPEPSHSAAAHSTNDLFGKRYKPWRAAREIIDWSKQGKSIFGRKKPLVDKTLNRILVGLEKFGFAPFIVPNFGEREGQQPRSHATDEPMPSVTGHGAGGLVQCQPFIVTVDHKGGSRPGASKGANGGQAQSADNPLTTVTSKQRHAVCQPFILGQQSCSAARGMDEPIPTVAGAGAIGLAQPYLVKFYGTAEASSIEKPLDTVTSKDRFGLALPIVEINGEKYLLDILFRMLEPLELARAQGFHDDYKFTGNKSEVVKQIGNAVPRNLAKALVRSAITQKG